jgi:hypothetical protein
MSITSVLATSDGWTRSSSATNAEATRWNPSKTKRGWVSASASGRTPRDRTPSRSRTPRSRR